MAEKPEEKPEVETPAEEADAVDLKKIVECLGKCGLQLGEGVTDENLKERLLAACETKAHADGYTEEEEEPPVESDKGIKPAESSPLMMSLQRQLQEQKDRADRLEKRTIADAKRSAKQRAKALLGYLDKPAVDKLCAELDRQPMRLSLDGGIEESPALIRLGAYEEMAARAGNPYTGRQRGEIRPVDPPSESDQAEDEKQSRAAGKLLADMALGRK